MKQQLVLSIDIGTTGLKFGLYNSEGHVLYYLRKNTPLIERELGTLDAIHIYNEVIQGIQEIATESGLAEQIEVIGICGQMGGIIGVDAKWEPVIPFDPPINNNYKPHMNDALRVHGSVITEETGSIPINGSKIVFWMKEQQAIFKEVKKIVTIAGYIIGKLIGIDSDNAFIDRTSLYLFGLGFGNTWSEKICNLLQVPIEILPAIEEPGNIVGTLDRATSRICGLKEEISIIAGMGDTAASILGAGIVEEGDVVDIAGTCSVFSICTAKDIIDRENKALLRLEAPIPDTYYLVGIGFGGEVYNWFLKNVYLCDNDSNVHEKLMKQAEKVLPGSENLLFFPFLGGNFTPPNDVVRGTWFGLDWEHTIFHMYRSVLESIAYEYYYYYNIYNKISENEINRPVTVTGSGRKNELWNQIKSDVLGLDYVVLNRDDHECLGTALVAASAVGLMTDLKKGLKNILNEGKRFVSNKAHQKEYERIRRLYLKYKKDTINQIYKNYY